MLLYLDKGSLQMCGFFFLPDFFSDGEVILDYRLS